MNCKVFGTIGGVLDFCDKHGDNNIVSITMDKGGYYNVFYKENNFQ